MKKPKKDDANADLIKGLLISLAKAGGPSKQFDILIHTALGRSLQDDIPLYTLVVEDAITTIPAGYLGNVSLYGPDIERQHRCLLRYTGSSRLHTVSGDGSNVAIAIVAAALKAIRE